MSSFIYFLIFTESALRPIQSYSRNVCMSVCVFVCVSVTPRKPRVPMDYRPLVEWHIANIGISLDVFEFSHFR